MGGFQGRILLTDDRDNPDFAYERLATDLPMPGVWVIGNRFPVGQAFEESCWCCSGAAPMSGRGLCATSRSDASAVADSR